MTLASLPRATACSSFLLPPSRSSRYSTRQMRQMSSAPTTLPMTMPAMAPWLKPEEEEEDVDGAGAAEDWDALVTKLLGALVATPALLPALRLALLLLLELLVTPG